jgi:hypothetical protein
VLKPSQYARTKRSAVEGRLRRVIFSLAGEDLFQPLETGSLAHNDEEIAALVF